MRKKPFVSLVAAALLLGAVSTASAIEAAFVKADTLIKEGKAADAYALLDPLESKFAGDPTYDYLLATAALQAGNPSRATFIYERILAINPDFIGVRADMGRAYFQMGDLARAKLEFEAILALTDLPPDLRSAVESYLATVDQRVSGSKTVYRGYMEGGFGRDSNVFASSSLQNLCFVNPAVCIPNEKRSDNYLSYALGGELIHTFDDQISVYAGLDYRGRGYRNRDTADNYTVDARTGLQYTSGRSLIRLGFQGGGYWLNNDSTRNSQGGSLDYRYLLNDTNQLTASGSYVAYRYVPTSFKVENFDAASANLGWTHVLAPTTVSVINLTAGAEYALGSRPSGDKNYWGVRGTLQHGFSAQIGAFISAGQQWANYAKADPLFDRKRDDRLLDVTVGMVWSLPDRWSVRPMYVHTNNRSNQELYSYQRHDVSVSLRKDF